MTALPTPYTVTGMRVHCGECGRDLSGERYHSDGVCTTVTCPICGSDWGPDELHFDAQETDSSYAWEQVERLTAEAANLRALRASDARQMDVLAEAVRQRELPSEDVQQLQATNKELRTQVLQMAGEVQDG